MIALCADIRGRVGNLMIEASIESHSGTLALVGPNGSGKTSLLLMILGILRPQSGRLVVGNTPLLDTSTGLSVPVEYRRLGYVPQDSALFAHMTVLQNVEFAIACSSSSTKRLVRRDRASAMLSDLGLSQLTTRRTADLSGGERQKVALARALATNPQALLLDEPLAALDATSRGEVRAFLTCQLKELNIPAIIVTHDPTDAATLGDSVAVLDAGRITQIGTWQALRERPSSRFVEQFVAT